MLPAPSAHGLERYRRQPPQHGEAAADGVGTGREPLVRQGLPRRVVGDRVGVDHVVEVGHEVLRLPRGGGDREDGAPRIDHPGEHERIVYVVEGSDAGWRANWQYGKYLDPRNNRYHPWMDEGLYRPRFEGQAAYILPPLAPFHVGPTGMAYNPGTALSGEWRNHFFVSEFTGSPANATIRIQG